MAGRRLFSKALAFLPPSHPIRRHSISAGAQEINLPKPAHVPIPQSDSVLSVLQYRDLAAEDIAGFASRGLLDSKLSPELGAKFDLLRGLGFSASDVAKLLQKSRLLSNVSLANLQQRIEFLRSLVDDNDTAVMTMIKSALWTISGPHTIKKRITDNMALLKKWGFADEKIKAFLVYRTRVFQQTPQSIAAAAERAQTEFGVAHDSKWFFYHVSVWSSQPDSTRQAKVRVFERFGWQSSDVHALTKSYPICFMLSAAKLGKSLEFFMNTAGFIPSQITGRGWILGSSLEGRVVPRYHLIQALKSKCLVPKNLSFLSSLRLVEKDFRSKFVDKFAEMEPDACKAYMSSVTLAQKK